jgi:hypothetical protein
LTNRYDITSGNVSAAISLPVLLGSPKGLAAVGRLLDSSTAFVKTPGLASLPEATLDGW